MDQWIIGSMNGNQHCSIDPVIQQSNRLYELSHEYFVTHFRIGKL